MGAAMTLSSESPVLIARFTSAERWAHRSIAILTIVLLVTAAFLYIPDLGGIIGNRQIVRIVHEVAGFALPIPIVIALFSRAFRTDTGRLNRFLPSDWEWLRKRDRRSGRIPVGKFNAGQKLNAAFSLGWIIVMFTTGTMMFFSSMFVDSLRTGATFVHDWLTLAVFVVVVGHIYMAYNDSTARAGMRTGSVPVAWARREHAAWADEVARVSSGGDDGANALK
jgi:formate dehydrogenase subunit gamma